jgi:hypothetical protein
MTKLELFVECMNMATTLQMTNPFYTGPEQIEEAARYLFRAATGYDYDTGPMRSLDTEVR